MLRLIAAALIVTFSLLGLAEADRPYANARLAPLGADVRAVGSADLVAGGRYAVDDAAGLKERPEVEANALAQISVGAEVLLLSVARNGYVHIRDDAGRTGYLPVAALDTSS